ncbi:MAG: PAS domain S-box protein [Halobacteriota archaeon]
MSNRSDRNVDSYPNGASPVSVASIAVLHVDDDPEFTDVVATFLEREDDRLDVTTATSVAEAERILETRRVDCIVSDYEMPRRDGIDFLRTVRERHENLPYVLYTGRGSEEVASEAISAGVSDYLQKSSGTEQYAVLANRITNAVSKYRAETQLADLLDRMTDAFVTLDADWQITYLNQRAEAVLERDRDALLGTDIRESFPDVENSKIRQAYTDAIEDGATTSIDVRCEPLEKWFEVHVYPSEVGVSAHLRDVTEHKARERALEETTERLGLALEGAELGVWDWDVRTDEVTFTDEWASLLGYSPADLESDLQTWTQRIHPADRSDVEATLDAHLAGDTEYYTCEYRMRTNSGDWTWIRDVGRVFERDDEGRPVRAVGIHQDVSDRKTRERELQRYETVVEASGDIVYTLDEDGYVTYVNDAFVDAVGYDRAALLGEHVSIVMSSADVQRGTELIRSLLRSADNRGTFEMDLQTATGESIPCETHVALLPDDDRFRGTVGITRDITARKDRERTLEQLQRRTQDLIRATSKREIADIAVETAQNTLELPFSGVHLVDDERERLEPVAVTDEVRDRVGSAPTYHRTTPQRSVDVVNWNAFERSETVVIDDARSHPIMSEEDTPTRSGIIQPLGSHGIFVTTAPQPHYFDETDVALMDVFAAVVTAAFDRAERERLLGRERERFETLFEHLPVSAVHATIEDEAPIVRQVNEQFEETFGYDAAAIVGENIDEFLAPPEGIDELTAVNRELLERGHVDTRVRRQTATGVRQFHAKIVLRTPTTDELDAYAIYVDVTEQQRRQAALETLHETSHELIDATTPQRIAELTVEAASEILGFPFVLVRFHDAEADELVPIAANDALEEAVGSPPAFGPHDGSLNWEAFETGEIRRCGDIEAIDHAYDRPTPVRSLLILPLGEYGIVSVGSTEANAFDESDAYLARILTTTATTALSRTEREDELERQNDRLETFTSIVSHDLRNPLNVATGHLELAATSGDSQHLEEVANAHDRMESLIEDVLTIAREGETVQNPTPIELPTLLTDCWHTVETADATLEIETEAVLMGDRRRLRQLLENLIRNAIDHGGEAVTITVGDLDDGFYVADDGPGIPADERAHVFDHGYTTSKTGTGFGLPIVHQLADAHGWRIGVASSEAGGARFEITGVQFDSA